MTKHITRRNFLKTSAGTITGLTLLQQTTSAQTLNPIRLENAKPGTNEWQLTSPATNREIEGYASRTSVNRGGSISFYVSCKESAYTIEIFRLGWYGGLGGRRLTTAVRRSGIRQTMPTAQSGTFLIECKWTSPYTITIPNTTDATDWCSGFYVAKLMALTSKRQRYIPFVVRDDARNSKLLFQSAVTTYQAYNNWGGKSLYDFNSTNQRRASKVSFNRPYFDGYGSGDLIDEGKGWELNMARFLEREGYDVTYCTNVDTHEQPNLLLTHQGFLSVGHDEYWSASMRNNVQAARDKAVNLGFFGANACFYQIRFEPSTATLAPNRTIVCYKDSLKDPLYKDAANRQLTTLEWRDPILNRPEDALIGVMYDHNPVQGDIVISNASYWIFNGTGLKNGDRIKGLLGYEVDRVFGNAPSNLVKLAESPYDRNGQTAYSNMSLYYWMGAKVFATGTIQWAWGLDDFMSGVVHANYVSPAAIQITRNVLNSFIA